VRILDEAEALRRLRAQADERLKALSISLFLEMFGNPLSGSSQWQTQRVSDICDLVRGSSPRPKGDPRYFGGPVPRLMIEDITRDGWWVTPRVDSLTFEGARLSRPVKAGTVVMAVRGYPEIQDANFTESAVTLLSWNSGRSCEVSLRSIT